jgi:hypothetical protein
MSASLNKHTPIHKSSINIRYGIFFRLFKQKAKGPALYIKPERQHTVHSTNHNTTQRSAHQSAGRPSDRIQYKIKHERTTPTQEGRSSPIEQQE